LPLLLVLGEYLLLLATHGAIAAIEAIAAIAAIAASAASAAATVSWS
jgi:hypothetical protein